VGWWGEVGGPDGRGAGGVDGFTGFVDVHGLNRVALAELFLQERIRVLGLAPVRISLQDVYADLTTDLERHRSSGGVLPGPPGSRDYQYPVRMDGPGGSRSTEGVAGR
jgi:hypothetical protein